MTELGTSPKRRLGALAYALAIGAGGGALFLWLDTPLPWMIGAMVFTTVAALAGTRIHMPQRLRSFMIAVLGVMLGSQFTPDLMERVGQWPATLASLVGYVALAGGATYVYLRRAAGLDRVTAYFAASPGGLNEMIVAGAALGADDRTIALVHASRVLLIVLTVPFWFRLMKDYDAAARVAATATGAGAPDALLIRAATGVVGGLAARAVRLPA
ncbi:MAG: AbrB family transcriptional regulator, partial [Alphaproteobacteria bacterium]